MKEVLKKRFRHVWPIEGAIFTARFVFQIQEFGPPKQNGGAPAFAGHDAHAVVKISGRVSASAAAPVAAEKPREKEEEEAFELLFRRREKS